VGSVKRCKNPKCKIILQEHVGVGRPIEYCENCQQRFQNANWQNTYRMRHEKARVGNSRQDAEIMKFLKKKRENEDKRYDKLR
jgi:hypothetical protein